MEIRPVDLPLLRDETVEFFTHHGVFINGVQLKEGSLINIKKAFPVSGSPERDAEKLIKVEVELLNDAELFHVSREMTDVALAAAAALPTFDLMPEDLVAPSGLMYFDKSLPVFDNVVGYVERGSPPVVAIGWGTVKGTTRPGIWLTFFSSRDETLDGYLRLGIYTAEDISLARRWYGRLLPARRAFLPFGIDRDDNVPTSAFGDLGPAMLKTSWLLMTQPLASVEDAQYDRAARRRIQRQGKEPPRVRVITLRRPSNPGGTGESDREWHHQWIVRGHWRQQWYPARQVHRPVWIAPHVKGPEGKPMLGGEKVYALRK